MLLKCMMFAVRTAMLAMIAWHQVMPERERRAMWPRAGRDAPKAGN